MKKRLGQKNKTFLTFHKGGLVEFYSLDYFKFTHN